jgi:hypothetical protein
MTREAPDEQPFLLVDPPPSQGIAAFPNKAYGTVFLVALPTGTRVRNT